jgi:hypothetical protein
MGKTIRAVLEGICWIFFVGMLVLGILFGNIILIFNGAAFTFLLIIGAIFGGKDDCEDRSKWR